MLFAALMRHYVDDYNKVSTFLSDPCPYYRDYPERTPERIQLL